MKEIINIGIQGNDGTGDSIRDAFSKVNSNFDQLYSIFGVEGTIKFSKLDDGCTYTGNQIIMAQADGKKLSARTLESGTNITIDATPTTIRISAPASQLSSDSSPEITHTFNTNYKTIGRVRSPSQAAVDEFNQEWNANTTLDDLPVTVGYANQNFVSSIGGVIGLKDANGNVIPLSGRDEPSAPDITNENYDSSLTGNYLATELVPRKNLVYRGGDTMTGSLILNDHPAPLAGVVNSSNVTDYQATTKFYVDSKTFSSNVNLYVSTSSGNDLQINTPIGKEGRYWNYAFKTLGGALLHAEYLVNLASQEPGPYKQRLSYTIGVDQSFSTIQKVQLTSGRSDISNVVMGNSTISGTTLTVGSITSGSVAIGQLLSGTNVQANTYITANISGLGAGSTWLVSVSQSVSSTSITGSTTSPGFIAAYDLLQANVEFIQAETVAYINKKYVNKFEYTSSTFSSELLFKDALSSVLTALSYDLVLGSVTPDVNVPQTNYNSYWNAVEYMNNHSTSDGLVQWVAAVEYLQNQLIDFSYSVSNLQDYTTKIVNSLAYDLAFGSNYQSIQTGLTFKNSNTGISTEQLSGMLEVNPIRILSASREGSIVTITFLPQSVNQFPVGSRIFVNAVFQSVIDINSTVTILPTDNSGNIVSFVVRASTLNTIQFEYVNLLFNAGSHTIIGTATFDKLNLINQILNLQLISQTANSITFLTNLAKIITNVASGGSIPAVSLPSLTQVPNGYNVTGYNNAAELLLENIPFIQAEIISFLSAEYPNVSYNRELCLRDIKYIIWSLAYDVVYGGNSQSINAGTQYWNNITSYLGSSEISACSAAVSYINTLAQSIIINSVTNTIYQQSIKQYRNDSLVSGSVASTSISNNVSAIVNIITRFTIDGISITGTSGQFLCNSTTLSVGQGIVISGTKSGTGSISSYPNTTVFYIIATNGSTTFQLSTTLGGTAISTTVGTPLGLTFIVYPTYYPTVLPSITYISSDLQTLRSAIIAKIVNFTSLVDINETDNMSPSTTSWFIDHFYPVINDSNSKSKIISLINDITTLVKQGSYDSFVPSFPSTVLSIYGNITSTMLSDTRIAILGAASSIATSVYNTFSVDHPSLVSSINVAIFKRDVKALIYAVCYDISFGGTLASVNAGKAFTLVSTKSITQQVIGYVATAVLAVVPVGYVAVTNLVTAKFTIASDVFRTINPVTSGDAANLGLYANDDTYKSSISLRQLILDNSDELISKTVNYVTSTFTGGFTYDESLCYRDVGLIINAMSVDLITDGNWQSVNAGKSYYKNASSKSIAIGTEYTQTIDGILFARDVALQVLDKTSAVRFQSLVTQVTTISNVNNLPSTSINISGSTTLAVSALARNTFISNMKITTDIIQYGLGVAPSPIFGSGLWHVSVSNGGNNYVDQGSPANNDIFPAKIISGVGKASIGISASNATASIVKYSPGGDEINIISNVDTIQARLIRPELFKIGEEIEFGETVRDLNIVIFVESGIYYEDFPLRIPANVSLKGDEVRRTIIRPRDRVSQSPWRKIFFYRDAVIDSLQIGIINYTGTNYAPAGISATYTIISGNMIVTLSDNYQASVNWLGLVFTDSMSATLSTGTAVVTLTSGSTAELIIGQPLSKILGTGAFGTNATVLSIQSTTQFTASVNHLTAGSISFNPQNNLKRGKAVVTSVSGNTLNCTTVYPFASSGTRAAGTWFLVDTTNYGRHYLTNPLDVTSTAKNNKEIDVFLCNEGTRITGFTFQGHGGFVMVLDPEGTIKAKSPYIQECTSFSQSNNTKRFAGAQYVDGFAGRLYGNITSVQDAGLTVTVTGNANSGLDVRPPSTPCAFYLLGIRYQIDDVILYTQPTSTSGTVILRIDASTPFSTITSVTFTGTAGQCTCNSSLTLTVNQLITVVGTSSGAGAITGYTNPSTYKISATNGTSTFTLVNTNNSAIVTTVGVTTGLTFTTTVASASIPVNLEGGGSRAMLANNLSMFNDISYGVVVTNGGFSEQVCSFTYYAYNGYWANNGGNIRLVGCSNTFGSYGLRASGYDVTELPDSVTLANNMAQTVRVYKSGLFATEMDVDASSIWIASYDYIPTNLSEVEIDHRIAGGSISTYSISSIEKTTTLDSVSGQYVLRLNLGAAGSTVATSTGISYALYDNQLLTIRVLQKIKFTNVDNVKPTRPSTAVQYNDKLNDVYRIITYSSVESTGEELPAHTTILQSDNSFSYYKLTIAADSVLTTVDPDSGTKTQGSKVGDVKIGIELITDQFAVDQLNKGIYIFSWNGRIHQITGYTLVTSTVPNTAYISINPTAVVNQAATAFSGLVLTSPTITNGLVTGSKNFRYTIPSTSTPPVVDSFITISGNNNSSINGTYQIIAHTNTSITVYYPTDPGSFTSGTTTGASIATGLSKPIKSAFTLKAGYPAGSLAQVTIRISTCRATSHDFCDIGTGGYSTTNIPYSIYGEPSLPRDATKETLEEGVGRCFYVSTNQDGIFRVGRFFSVDQGTGTVTFSSKQALSNIEGFGFNTGVVVTSFSAESSMFDNASDVVPVQSAVRGYIDRRLGLSHDGVVMSPSLMIGPGYIPVNGAAVLTGNLNLGSHNIVNLATPTDSLQGANKSYVDVQVASRDSFSKLLDVSFSGTPSNSQIAIYDSTLSKWVNATIAGDVTLSYNSGTGTLTSTIGGGKIFNNMVSTSAAIAQSKLALTAASTRANATGIAQSDLGVASFNSTQFTSTNGWIELAAGGTSISKLQQIAANSVVANITTNAAVPVAVTTDDIVLSGNGLRHPSFTSVGAMVTTSANGTSNNVYSVLNITTSGAFNSLVKTGTAGEIDSKQLKVDSYKIIDTLDSFPIASSTTSVVFTTPGGSTFMSSVGTDPVTTMSGTLDITAGTLKTTTLSAGTYSTAGTITGNWSLGAGSTLNLSGGIVTSSADGIEASSSRVRVKPALLLDFSNSKTLDPRVTFTRNSIATYYNPQGVMKTAAINQPRFNHDPTTGQIRGLLIEESRTNLVTFSTTFATSGGSQVWTYNNVTAVSQAGVAPDGGAAIQFAASANNATIVMTLPGGLPGLTYRTFSVWIKKISGTSTSIQFTLDNVAASPTWTTQAITSTLTRYTFAASQSKYNIAFRLPLNGDTVIIWGAQLEDGQFATSFIPTDANTVVRSTETATIAGTNFSRWYRQDEGTLLIEQSASVIHPSNVSYGTAIIQGATATITLGVSSTGTALSYNAIGATLNFNGTTSITVDSVVTHGIAYKANDSIYSYNGSVPESDTSVTVVSDMTNLTIGNGNGVQHIAKILYFPLRIANLELQRMTTQ